MGQGITGPGIKGIYPSQHFHVGPDAGFLLKELFHELQQEAELLPPNRVFQFPQAVVGVDQWGRLTEQRLARGGGIVHHHPHRALGPGLQGHHQPPTPFGDHRLLDQRPMAVDEPAEGGGDVLGQGPPLPRQLPQLGGGVFPDLSPLVDRPADGRRQLPLVRQAGHQGGQARGLLAAEGELEFPGRLQGLGYREEFFSSQVPVALCPVEEGPEVGDGPGGKAPPHRGQHLLHQTELPLQPTSVRRGLAR